MKKKIVAVLLCVLIVCTVGVSLVACNNDTDTSKNYAGTWIGYCKGDKEFQFYATIQYDGPWYLGLRVMNPDGEILYYDATIHNPDEEIEFSHNITFVGQKFVISKITNDKFTLTGSNNNKVLHFKRSNISITQWTNHAFGSDGAPYYYED